MTNYFVRHELIQNEEKFEDHMHMSFKIERKLSMEHKPYITTTNVL